MEKESKLYHHKRFMKQMNVIALQVFRYTYFNY